MTSDDFGALAAITLGALVAITATVTWIDMEPAGLDMPRQDAVHLHVRSSLGAASPGVVRLERVRTTTLMAGPEGPHSGWAPGER